MNLFKPALLLPAMLFVSACASALAPKMDKTVDLFVDSKDLTELKAGIWIDSDGCDHWIIDDGTEGYLSARLDPQGRPVCSGIAQRNTAVGNFRAGTNVGDPV
jgi:hypothetical protein